MSSSSTETPENNAPEIVWTWSAADSGALCTLIQSDGMLLQVRYYAPEKEPVVERLGKVKAATVQRIHALAAAAIAAEGASRGSADATDDATAGRESLDVRVTVGGSRSGAHIALKELDRHPEMARLRAAIVQACSRTVGLFSLANVGLRLCLGFLCLVGYMFYLYFDGRSELDHLNRAAQRLDATVIRRTGSNGNDKYKSITVRILPQGASQPKEVKINEYLSSANWDASKPGTVTRIWFDAASSKAALENDLLRNLHDRRQFPTDEVCISSVLALLALFLTRYRSGVYPDGKQYMVRGDRVTLDGKALPFNDGQLLALRLLFRAVS